MLSSQAGEDTSAPSNRWVNIVWKCKELYQAIENCVSNAGFTINQVPAQGYSSYI